MMFRSIRPPIKSLKPPINNIRKPVDNLFNYKPIKHAIGYGTFFIVCTSAFSFIHSQVLEFHFVNGTSMVPSLSPSVHETGTRDLIVTLKRGWWWNPLKDEGPPHVRTILQRGDVITMWKPHDPEEVGVKRVVGLPGDTIIRDVRRVGKQSKEDGKYSKKMGMDGLPPVVTVPAGHVWAEGDNWRVSIDSNHFGPVALNMVQGRAAAIIWPLNRFGKSLAITDEPKHASRTIVIPGKAELPDAWDGI